MDAEILKSIAEALQARQIDKLRATGSRLSEEAFLEGSHELVQLSAIAYSLAKFLEKGYVAQSVEWKVFSRLVEQKLVACAQYASAGADEQAKTTLSSAVRDIEHLSRSMGRFQESVLTKARVKIATDAYAHGASLGRACALAGVDKKLVFNYIGVTKLAEKYESLPLPKRLSKARELFSDKQ